MSSLWKQKKEQARNGQKSIGIGKPYPKEKLETIWENYMHMVNV